MLNLCQAHVASGGFCGKTAKSGPIYSTRFVNVVADCIVKHAKTIIGLGKCLSNHEKIFNERQKKKTNPLFVFRRAMHRVTCNIAVKARRVVDRLT